MTVNIVVFIDCYSTIYSFYYVHLLKKKKKKMAHAYFGRLVFSKFFGGKIKNFEQGFGEQKMTKNRSDLMSKIA